MPDRTVNEIIDDAYLACRVLQPNSVDDARALSAFQNMLSSWSVEGLIVPYYVTENFTLTSGQAVYTIGVTGDSPDLVTATGRPIRITDAFIRISGFDHPIDIGMTKSQYNALSSKDLETRPWRLYYDPQYPKGTIKFNREANGALDFHLVSEKALTDVTAITDTLSLPLEMNEPLVYNLAIRLAPQKKIKLESTVFVIANDSKDTLKRINSIEKQGDLVTLDRALLISGRRRMDINGGE